VTGIRLGLSLGAGDDYDFPVGKVLVERVVKYLSAHRSGHFYEARAKEVTGFLIPWL